MISIGDFVKTNRDYEPEPYVEGIVTSIIVNEGDTLVEVDQGILIYEYYLEKVDVQ